MTALRSLLLVSASLTFSVTPAQAQGDSSRAIPPGVTAATLKRLGEVVDGQRTGATIYVVMSNRAPYAVAAITSTADSARTLAAAAGEGFWAFGPYVTIPDNRVEMYATTQCPKDKTSSLIICPDTSAATATPMSRVAEVIVSVRTTDGVLHTQHFAPDHLEALFFTLSAYDKFAIPYYERVLGLGYATDLRNRMVRWFALH